MEMLWGVGEELRGLLRRAFEEGFCFLVGFMGVVDYMIVWVLLVLCK